MVSFWLSFQLGEKFFHPWYFQLVECGLNFWTLSLVVLGGFEVHLD